jgi:hypothetical protein
MDAFKDGVGITEVDELALFGIHREPYLVKGRDKTLQVRKNTVSLSTKSSIVEIPSVKGTRNFLGDVIDC